MSETLVVLDDKSNVLAAYVIANTDVLLAFTTLLNFIGFDKYYLVPKPLHRANKFNEERIET